MMPTLSMVNLTNDELISNACAIYIVGLETISYTLGYLFYCLGQHPDVQAKPQQEIQDTFTSDDTSNISMKWVACDQMIQMKYLDAVIKETLRIYPTATGFTTRKAHSEFTYGCRTFPAGLNILLAVTVIHRDPRNWPDPLAFKPERLDADSSERSHQLAYQAFG